MSSKRCFILNSTFFGKEDKFEVVSTLIFVREAEEHFGLVAGLILRFFIG